MLRSTEVDALNRFWTAAEDADLVSDSRDVNDPGSSSSLFPLPGSALWDSRSMRGKSRFVDWTEVAVEPRLDEDAAENPEDDSPREWEEDWEEEKE